MKVILKRELEKTAIGRYLLNKIRKAMNKFEENRIILYFKDRRDLHKFFWYLNDDDYIYEKEIELLPKILSFGDKVIDVGANIGPYTYYLSKIVGEAGIVYAFEPGKRAYNLLTSVLKKYNLNNVQNFNIAISNKEGHVTLHVPFYSTGHAQIDNKGPIKGKREIVRTITLDEFYFSNSIQNLRFIKCDCEGAELEVFQGATNVLKKEKPIILCEIAEVHSIKFGHSSNDVLKFLSELGYKCFVYDYKKEILVPTHEIHFVGTGHVWSDKGANLANNNYVFIHESEIDNSRTYINFKEV
ncbi:Hexuronic acid methyltransferase AglP [ANME-1 cluster archaeon GoMg3.2]|nr:Hexuronic acid methyltransferase AglP [ANME-1 cluster archaeon GoMg3.2]